jgi:hypothetical protein
MIKQGLGLPLQLARLYRYHLEPQQQRLVCHF